MTQYELPPELLQQDLYSQNQMDMTKWRLDAEDILEDLRHDLLGMGWDGDKQEWVARSKPLVNSEGARAIISICRMAINKSTFLSNLEENDILTICRSVTKTIIKSIFLSWKNWEIAKENAGAIVVQTREFIFISLMRAKNEGERLSLGRTERVIRAYGDKKERRRDKFPFMFGKSREEREYG